MSEVGFEPGLPTNLETNFFFKCDTEVKPVFQKHGKPVHLISIPIFIRSKLNFAQATGAMLSWPVQNFILIGYILVKI